jgi:hypothetical protein
MLFFFILSFKQTLYYLNKNIYSFERYSEEFFYFKLDDETSEAGIYKNDEEEYF